MSEEKKEVFEVEEVIDLEDWNEEDTDDEISIRDLLGEMAMDVLSTVFKTKSLFCLSLIAYILCCATRLLANTSSFAGFILSEGYIFIKWIAVGTFGAWGAVNTVKRSISVSKRKKILVALIFSLVFSVVFESARAILLYIQFATYGLGWNKPMLIGNIIMSDLLYGATGIPASCGLLLMVIIVINLVLGLVAAPLVERLKSRR